MSEGMKYLLGTVLSVIMIVGVISLLVTVYKTTTRKTLAITSIISCAVCFVIEPLITGMLETAPYIVLLFLMMIAGSVAIYGGFGLLIAIFGYKKKRLKIRKTSDDSGKIAMTVVLAIIGLLCAGTGILVPLSYTCRFAIKQIWNEK